MSTYAPQIAVALLVPVEVLGFTLVFDAGRLVAIPTFWAQLVAWAPQTLRLACSVAAAVLGLSALNQPTELLAVMTTRQARSRVSAAAVHFVSLAAFAVMTSVILEAGPRYIASPAFWTIMWFLTGGLTLCGALWLLLPWKRWRTLTALAPGSIAAGAGVGTIGWAFGSLAQEFWAPMARQTFAVVNALLRLLYTETVSDPGRLLIGTPRFRVIVSERCSGYEGVGLILVFLAVYLWVFRKELRFPGALVLLPIGAVLIWSANILRIIALIAIGTAGWRAAATGGFHSQAGWIAFNAIALGFVALINQYGCFRVPTAPDSEPARVSTETAEQTTAYLGPFIMISATAMITGAFSSGFDWLYPLRVVAVAVVLWMFREQYARLRWSWSWWSLAIGAMTFLMWMALTPTATGRNSGWPAALQSMPLGWAVAWLFFRSLGYVVMAPLAEELAFRGFLTRRLSRVDFHNLPLGAFSWWSFVVSSVVFGALHGSHWLPGTVAGMSFGLALYRRGVLGEAVWAHATTNGLIAVYALATGRWWMWS